MEKKQVIELKCPDSKAQEIAQNFFKTLNPSVKVNNSTPILNKIPYKLPEKDEWVSEKGWSEVLKGSNDEIMGFLFDKPREIQEYRQVPAASVYSTGSSLHSVLKGVRPLGIISTNFQELAGFEERLKKCGFGLIKYSKVTEEEANDFTHKDLRRDKDIQYRLGEYKTWILYSLESKESALELLKASQGGDPYRSQRYGQLLYYKSQDIKDFCKKNNEPYLEGPLPPLTISLDEIDYEIS